MKISLFASIATLSICTINVQAASICQTPLTKQMLTSIKQDTTLAPIKPSKALLELMSNNEINCPLQVEKDFNGDKQLDWVGVISQKGEYHLISYLSGKNQYQLQKIKQYQRLPNNSFFDVSSKKRVQELTGISIKSTGNFAAVENSLKGSSEVFSLQGTKMARLGSFKNDLKN